jgi:hypothetical protein
MDNLPPYVDGRTPAQLEAAYAARRIDYLVGGADDDPQQARSTEAAPPKRKGRNVSRAPRRTTGISSRVIRTA